MNKVGKIESNQIAVKRLAVKGIHPIRIIGLFPNSESEIEELVFSFLV